MKKLTVVALLLVTGLFCLFAATDYYIQNYDVQITVGNNAVHHIVETLDVYFDGSHHGIVREIPLDYRDYDGRTARVRNLECSLPYSAEEDNGYLVVQIGSSSVTYRKETVRIVISYDYDLGADNNEGYDEFYMNIIGPDWECPIRNVSFAVTIPYVEDSGYADTEAFFEQVYENTHFTSGKYGSTSSDAHAYLTQNADGSLLIDGTVTGLDAYNAVTVRIDLPDGWYKGARQPWDFRPVMRIAHPIVCIIMVALALFIWAAVGRDQMPIIVARFKPPKDFSPLLVGYIADSTVDDKDIISMLFYWADEGLLSIEEKQNNKYEFTKLKDIEDYAVESGRHIPKFEITMFNGFFKNRKVGDKITFKDLEKNNFYETIARTKLQTKAYFVKDRALYEKKSQVWASVLGFLALVPVASGALRAGFYENRGAEILIGLVIGVLLFLCNLGAFYGLFRKWHLRKTNVPAMIMACLPSAIALAALLYADRMMSGNLNVLQNLLTVLGCGVTVCFAQITEKRSKYGNEVLEETLGFREFIDKAEISQLKMMIESDPDFYYRILSYAIVLGLEEKWARKFDGMIVSEPAWFTGLSPFDVYYLSRMSARMTRAIPMASIPKSSISGSPGSRAGGGGFHSSGFSGGGFGGGGGHAW
ncbi:MAG: DUF2207 domain-containing protein [Spirochaetales bacterium]|nr:DUF2207 domain-containing protein [Spirochaetales bacterium]